MDNHHEPWVCREVEDTQAAVLALLRHADRQVEILTHDFEPSLYDHDACLEALEDLALRSHHSRIRILIQEPQVAALRGHRLLTLGRRLTSRIEMRRPDPEASRIADSFLIVDGLGFLHRPYADSFKADACLSEPLTARALLQRFQAYWDVAETDPYLRRLTL